MSGGTSKRFQSNAEGAIVDFLYELVGWADGIIINAGAYTHPVHHWRRYRGDRPSGGGGAPEQRSRPGAIPDPIVAGGQLCGAGVRLWLAQLHS